MTEDQKAKKFEQIQAHLWGMVIQGNPLQSAMAAGLIRTLAIEGPDGQDPDDA